MTTILADRAALLDTIALAQGAHAPDSGQMCAMEAAAYIAGEPWSDSPQCVSPVIAAFLRSWNDALPDETRTALLRPLLPLVIGTRTTDADEETRAWMATDWLVRVHTPAWLRLAGLTDHAQALESFARIADATVAGNAQRTIDAARAAARASALTTAWDSAWDAARDAALATARDAAWASSLATAWDAAWVAARDAAWDAAWDTARDAAWASSLATAWDAAWVAARDAAWDTVGAAARAAIAPTVAMLQVSACDLVREMCAVGRAAETQTTPHAGGTDA
jgi:hypothetical protein